MIDSADIPKYSKPEPSIYIGVITPLVNKGLIDDDVTLTFINDLRSVYKFLYHLIKLREREKERQRRDRAREREKEREREKGGERKNSS